MVRALRELVSVLGLYAFMAVAVTGTPWGQGIVSIMAVAVLLITSGRR
jgi:hypothetical protein